MKKTKKNAILRVAVLLFAVTLLSTGLLGGTLAKYISSSGTVGGTARVAKWGVEIDFNESAAPLFAETYTVDDTTVTSLTSNLSVSADTAVLAPGTSGELSKITVSGKPEVACRVEISTGASEILGWVLEDGNTAYEPVLWTLVVGGTSLVTGGSFQTLTDALDAIVTNGDEVFDPNTDLENKIGEIEISWEWPFEVGADAGAIAANDAKDTYLGNLKGPAVPTITLNFGITITQID